MRQVLADQSTSSLNIAVTSGISARRGSAALAPLIQVNGGAPRMLILFQRRSSGGVSWNETDIGSHYSTKAANVLASNANLAATHGLTKHGQNTDKAQPRDGDFLRRLRTHLAGAVDWQVPEPDTRRVAGVAWDAATVTARVKRLVEHHVRLDLEPFLNTMRRRLDRDRGRIHAYHDDLHRTAQMKLAALASASGEKAEADQKRETLRIAAIEREYGAKLDHLRHNCDLRVTVDWVQGLALLWQIFLA